MGLMLFLFSCSTYNQQTTQYYNQVRKGDYEAANKSLDKNKLLTKDRNKLLYLLEKGKNYHMLHQPDSSNQYFNLADEYMEQAKKNVGDAAVSTFINPMMERYKGEDFEKFMIHYYKALNYLYLNKKEDAIVEARRISLQTQQQGDKYNDKANRYSKDAFSMIMQGALYESNWDVNNAFIAYRNALEVFESSPNKVHYGVLLPEQLKWDLLRTAYLNGFSSDVDFYERKFNLKYQAKPVSEGGELLLFWENGFAPIKDQQEFFFALLRGAGGVFYFSDPSGQITFPFTDASTINNMGAVDLNEFRSIRVTFPKYIPQPTYYKSAAVSIDNSAAINLELVEDINTLAIQNLKERRLKELGSALSRVAVKKITEYFLRGGNKKGESSDFQQIAGSALGLYNMLSEKADTRNWQTLPSSISYTRIPLQKGKNVIQLKARADSGGEDTYTFNVEGTGKLVLYNYSTQK